MAQAFVTTNQKCYRWHKIQRQKSLRPVDRLTESLPEGDIWLVPKKIGEEDEEGETSLVKVEETIQRMYRKRLWSTYQVEYCPDLIPKDEDQEEVFLENAVLNLGQKLYSKKSQKIPPPLPTARKC